jgi:Peptidyl-prolyl cis-trans isomerase (rotamase) - cyclophilin family
MKQLYTITAIVIILIAGLYVAARLPMWLSDDAPADNGTTTAEADVAGEQSPPTEPPMPSEEELAEFEEMLQNVTPEDLADNPELLQMNNDTQAPEPAATEGPTRATLKTNKGDITLELYTDRMPITAGNFVQLARDDFYDGVKFHRVIEGFMIQGGDPLTKDDSQQGRWGTGGPGYAIEDEHVPGEWHTNARGTIAMANSGPNSGGSQFFINLVDNTNLDFDKQPLSSKHPVFGRVVSGMDVVDAIGGVETGPRDVPVEPVVIEDVVVE